MKTFKPLSTLVALACILFFSFFANAQKALEGMQSKPFNYSTFAKAPSISVQAGLHPEEGILPYNAPCTDCIEDISERKIDYRLFTGIGENKGLVYSQSGYGAIHFERNGQWITIDGRFQKIAENVFGAHNQNFPTEVDFNLNQSAIKNPNGSFVFNRELVLMHEENGNIQFLSSANYNDFKVGENGAYITEVFPGIDMEIRGGIGNLKTNFILKEKPNLHSGKLIIRDNTILPVGWKFNKIGEDISLINENGVEEFSIAQAFGYDDSGRENGMQLFSYSYNESVLDIEIPLEEINAAHLKYPYTIDPLVNSSAVLPTASITGSGYNAVCFNGFCSYYVTVPPPANAQIVDILWSFNYIATSPCWLNEGAITFHTSNCSSPNAAGYYWFCNSIGSGSCTGSNISMIGHIQTCVPGPSCNPAGMQFEMRFRRCFSSGGCSNSCIGAGSPWTMTIVGRTVEPVSISANGSSTVTVCANTPVSLSASANYGVPPYTYTWNPGNITGNPVTVNPSATTNYAVTITDACGNTASQNINVNVIPAPASPNLTYNGPICQGQTLNLSSNIGGIIGWTGPNGFTSNLQNPTIPNATTAASGTYSAYVVVGGCSSLVSTLNVVVNPTPATPTLGSNSPICSGNTINLTSSGSGMIWSGPNSFNSTLQNPSITQANSSHAGTYTAYSVSNGCSSASSTVTVVVNATPPTPTIGSNSPICTGQTLNLTSNASTGAVWTGPNGFTSNLQNPTIPNASTAASGTYSAYEVVGGCSSLVSTLNVVVNPTPATPTLGSNSPICSGNTINLTSSGSGMIWSGPNSFNSTLQNPSITQANSSHAGTYTAYSVSNGCSSASSTVTVVVNATPPTPTIGSNSPICTGQTLNLTSNASTGAVWSGPNGFTSNLQNPTIPNISTAASGTYSLYQVTGSCTSSTVTLIVQVNSTPASPTLSSNSPVCSGNSINLSSTGSGLLWSGPNGFSSSIANPTLANATTNMGGLYTATSIANGCTSAVSSINVIVNSSPALPTISVNSPLCEGQTLNFTSNASTGAVWSGPNGFSSTLQNPSITSATPANNGSYSLVVVQNGCTSAVANAQVTINQNPPVPTITSNSPACSGTPFQLSASGLGSQVFWSGPNNFLSTNPSPSIPSLNINNSGAYYVYNILNGCSTVSQVFNLVVLQSPQSPVLSSNAPICVGENLQLNSDIPVYWLGPNNWVSATQNPVINNAQTSHSGSYSAVAFNGVCSSSVVTHVVQVNPIPAIPNFTSNDPVCEGTSLLLNGPNGSNFQFLWTGPNGFSSSIEDPQIINVTNSNAGTYNLTVVSNGCTSAVATQNIGVLPVIYTQVTGAKCANSSYVYNGQVFPLPGNYQLTYTGKNGCDSIVNITITQLPSPSPGFYIPSSISILNPSVVIVDGSINASIVSYQWEGGDFVGNNPTITFTEPGIYEIWQFVENGNCKDSISRIIHVQADANAYIPNAFTPNEDDINSVFKVIIPMVQEFEMIIFNRWGEKVFETMDIYEGWDGTLNNNKAVALEMGVYVYRLIYKDINGAYEEKFGHVTLIR